MGIGQAEGRQVPAVDSARSQRPGRMPRPGGPTVCDGRGWHRCDQVHRAGKSQRMLGLTDLRIVVMLVCVVSMRDDG
jgi:hypothetical protein